MISKEVLIINPSGLHARPAAQLCDLCQEFICDLKIEYNNEEIEPRSIISILCAAVRPGSKITLIADGEDEQKAIDEISLLIESFDE